MSILKDTISKLPDAKGCVVILSGGLDSTITMRLCVEKYGAENVHAITFNYGQRQQFEIQQAAKSTSLLGVSHEVVDLAFLKEIGKGFSCNVDYDMDMPKSEDVSKRHNPMTYVPNRNTIMLSIAAALCEVKGVEYIMAGFQISDFSGYWDTTRTYVDKINGLFSENRDIQVQVIAPFVGMSKADEIRCLIELDGNVQFVKNTITCYNPSEDGISCGECPSCLDRLKNFSELGIYDPIPYHSKVF